MITDQYAAGLFDGEGCVCSTASFHAGKYEKFPRVQVQITVSNNCVAALEALRERYGGSVRSKKSRNCHHWRVVGKQAMRHFLLSVLPHLIIKREEVLLALQFIETMREDCLGPEALPDKVHEQRKVIHLKLRKRKGDYGRKHKTFDEETPRAGAR